MDEGQTEASPVIRNNSGPLQYLLGGVHVAGTPQEPQAPPGGTTVVHLGSLPVAR